MIYAQNGRIYDPANGRDRTQEFISSEDNDFVETKSDDWFDQDYEENPTKMIKMKGPSATIDPTSGKVGEFAQTKS